MLLLRCGIGLRRSRKGAWIEIGAFSVAPSGNGVAPARERGLKSASGYEMAREIVVAPARERGLKSSDGVPLKKNLPVAPARERGLK